MADDLLYNDDIDLTPDDLDVSDGTSTGSDESTQDNPLNRWVIDTDTNAGTPGENPPTITPPTAPSEIHNVSVSVRRRYLIPTYDQDELQRIALTGATFYVVYTDGTEEICNYTDVVEPTGLATNEIVLEGEAIARAIGQHFWTDTQGVHVTDVTKDDWLDATVDQFDDLSSNKPYHNILMNSEGLLLRSALNNFMSLSRSGNTIYDGYGNNLENVLASFTYAGATFREEGKTKALINTRGLTLYDNSGTISNNQETLGTSIAQLGTNIFGEPYSRIGKENGYHISIEQKGLYGWYRDKVVFSSGINEDAIPEFYISDDSTPSVVIDHYIASVKNEVETTLYECEWVSSLIYKLYDPRFGSSEDPQWSFPIGMLKIKPPVSNATGPPINHSTIWTIMDMNEQVLYTIVDLNYGRVTYDQALTFHNAHPLSENSYLAIYYSENSEHYESYIGTSWTEYHEYAWYDSDGVEVSSDHVGEYIYMGSVYYNPVDSTHSDGLTFSGGGGIPYIKYGNDTMIPFFVDDDGSASAYGYTEAGIPTNPCIMYDTESKGLWYCHENTEEGMGGLISELIGGYFNSLITIGNTTTGTLTSKGNVDIRNPNVTVDTTSDNHVTTNQVTGYVIRDSTGLWYGRCEGVAYTDGRIETRISAINTKTDGSRVENDLSLYVAKDGTRTVWVTDSAPWRSALNVVNKSGDTMTGNLAVYNGNPYISTKTSTLTLNTSSNNAVTTNRAIGLALDDSNNQWFARYTGAYYTDGLVMARLGSRNCKTNGSFVENTLELRIKKDGTRAIAVTDPAIWRSALGVPATSHTHNTTTVTQITTLTSPTSINHLGYYAFGDIGGALLTKWNAAGAEKPGDYHAVVHDFNGSASGCAYGKMIVTSPRSTKIFLVNIWNSAWDNVRQI